MKKILIALLLLTYSLRSESDAIDIIVDQHVEDDFRVDIKKHKYIWTEPLIIDGNNSRFDDESVFKFDKNILYKPKLNYNYPSTYSDYPAAIIVAKDNITIDLAGFTLSLDPSSASNFMVNQPTYGIAIYQGVQNLRIISSSLGRQKGCITGFSGFGIYALGSDQSYNNYDIYSNMIKNLVIDNLLITQNINGIYIAHALEIEITNTHVVYNYSPRVIVGIYCRNILSGVIDSCNINQNTSYSDIFGVVLQDTTNMTIKRSEANANRSLKNGNASGMVITAIFPKLSYANEIIDCIANRNLCAFMQGRKSVGFSIRDLSHHNSIENCSSYFSSHSPLFAGTTPPTTPPTGIGFELDNSLFNQINKNKSGYHDTYGFYDSSSVSTTFWGENIGILNILDNYHVTTPTSTGSIALPTVDLYPSDVSAFTGAGPQLVNLSVKFPI